MKVTIEHWRAGECFEHLTVTDDMIRCDPNGATRIVVPVGQIVLASYDELHFTIHDAIATLTQARDSR
jgi:hypothetical protein